MNTPASTPVSAVNWFEIPVTDLDRAQRCYETLLGRPMKREVMGPHTLAVFDYQPGPGGGTGGCLIAGQAQMKPSSTGTVVYLNAEPSLDAALSRAAEAGAQVVVPRTELPEGMGAFAVLIDTEGNAVGLHALA